MTPITLEQSFEYSRLFSQQRQRSHALIAWSLGDKNSESELAIFCVKNQFPYPIYIWLLTVLDFCPLNTYFDEQGNFKP
jgi:hypothetical protein